MPQKKRAASVADFQLATFLPFRLAVVTDHVVRIFSEKYEGSSNLTIPEWRAIAVIAEHGTLSPTAVGQLGVMDKVKVSRATQSLVAKGLLRPRQDPGDGRVRLLRLTRKGVAIHARIVRLATELEATLFDDLSRNDLNALDRILSKVKSRVETAREAGPA